MDVVHKAFQTLAQSKLEKLSQYSDLRSPHKDPVFSMLSQVTRGKALTEKQIKFIDVMYDQMQAEVSDVHLSADDPDVIKSVESLRAYFKVRREYYRRKPGTSREIMKILESYDMRGWVPASTLAKVKADHARFFKRLEDPKIAPGELAMCPSGTYWSSTDGQSAHLMNVNIDRKDGVTSVSLRVPCLVVGMPYNFTAADGKEVDPDWVERVRDLKHGITPKQQKFIHLPNLMRTIVANERIFRVPNDILEPLEKKKRPRSGE